MEDQGSKNWVPVLDRHTNSYNVNVNGKASLIFGGLEDANEETDMNHND